MSIGSRVLFPRSPWPQGHQVTAARFYCRYGDDDAIYLHLHVESDVYSNAGTPSAESEDPWTSAAVWDNFQSATLSTDYWGHYGLCVRDGLGPFDITSLHDCSADVSKADCEEAEYSMFAAYVLGGQQIVSSHIDFTHHGDNLWSIVWSGELSPPPRMVNARLPEEFRVDLVEVPFLGFAVSRELTIDEAKSKLSQILPKGTELNLEPYGGLWLKRFN